MRAGRIMAGEKSLRSPRAGIQENAEPVEVVAVAGIAPGAASGAAAPAIAIPGPAAQDAALPVVRPLRVLLVGLVVGAETVPAPLPDVAVHIEKAQPVRSVGANRCRAPEV